MKTPLLLLVNPVAGHGLFRSALGEIVQSLHQGGFLPTVCFTEAPGQARALAARYGGDYPILVCLGGDGTLSDVMSGLMSLPQRPILGYIPAGTANDAATSLGLSRHHAEAVQTILRGSPTPYDVGRFGPDDYFSYIAAFGAFTEISYETSQDVKQALGQLAYLLQVMGRLPRLPSHRVRVEYDEGVMDMDLCFGGVTNTISMGRVVRLDDSLVGLGDGKFEVLLIRTPANIADMTNIISSILSKKYDNAHVTLLQSRRVRFTFLEPVAWTRDGEAGGLHQDLVLENIPAPLQIMVNKPPKT